MFKVFCVHIILSNLLLLPYTLAFFRQSVDAKRFKYRLFLHCNGFSVWNTNTSTSFFFRLWTEHRRAYRAHKHLSVSKAKSITFRAWLLGNNNSIRTSFRWTLGPNRFNNIHAYNTQNRIVLKRRKNDTRSFYALTFWHVFSICFELWISAVCFVFASCL